MGGAFSSASRTVSQLQAAGSDTEKEAAVKALGELAGTGPGRREEIVKAGAVPLLVGLVQSGSLRAKELAAGALSHLALTPGNKTAIAEAGGIRAIVELMRNGVGESKGAAAAAVANLTSGCAANQTAVAKEGGISLLVQLMEDSLPQVQGWAAVALGNVVLQHKDNQTLAGKAGGIEVLVRLAKSSEACSGVEQAPPGSSAFPISCRRRAVEQPKGNLCPEKRKGWMVKTLSCLAYSHERNQQLLVMAGGVALLVNFVGSDPPQIKLEAAKALCNVLSGCTEAKASFSESGGELVLNKLAGDSKNGDIAAALFANVCSGPEDLCPSVIAAGGVRTLINLLASAGAKGQQYAATALCAMAERDQENKTLIVEAGAIRPLVQLTSKGTPHAAVWACKTLASLAEGNPGNKKLIDEAGGAGVIDRMNLLGNMTITGLESETPKPRES
mmetsp:Transcript_36072/g.71377  ORF Transcript_36072/g.71377 Transcript_36072/m.71377 type:complete len:445 (+) Transcript_36072:61-1395(+)